MDAKKTCGGCYRTVDHATSCYRWHWIKQCGCQWCDEERARRGITLTGPVEQPEEDDD